MLHLRRRVRNVRNSHRTRDDVGWLIEGDTERLRSPGAGGGLQAAEKRDPERPESGLALDPLQSWLVDTMASRKTT